MKQVVDWEQLEAEELERIAKQEQMDSGKRWATYPKPNPFSQLYGYGSTLYKLKGDMGNHELSPWTREQAAKAYYKLLKTTKDRKLMGLRERLVRASQQPDSLEVAKISAQMKAYLKEDTETGHYGA